MQTTIDLPDDLLARAQELADEPMTPAVQRHRPTAQRSNRNNSVT